MLPIQSKKKKRAVLADNPIEAVRSVAGDIGSAVSSDLVGGMANDVFQQVLGTPKPKSNGELTPNQEIKLNQPPIEQPETSYRERVLAFQKQRQNMERDVFSYREDVEVQKKIEQLLKELRLLAKSTQNLSQEVSAIVVEEMPATPGKYHLNFFEMLIKVIKSLREKVDESATWLSVFYSKKEKRQYWSMFKKHGTTFGLSHERVVATQTG